MDGVGLVRRPTTAPAARLIIRTSHCPTRVMVIDVTCGQQRVTDIVGRTKIGRKNRIAAGRLVQPFPIVGGNDKSYYLVYPTAAAERPKIAAFREWLLAEVAEFRAQFKQPIARASYAKRRTAAR